MACGVGAHIKAWTCRSGGKGIEAVWQRDKHSEGMGLMRLKQLVSEELGRSSQWGSPYVWVEACSADKCLSDKGSAECGEGDEETGGTFNLLNASAVSLTF